MQDSTSVSKIKKVHFIGIGGIGMSGLARFFLAEGKEVSGSDREESDITRVLQEEGVTFFKEQKAENINIKGSDPLIDLVVYTEAMPSDHEELLEAKKHGIKTMNYFEALGMVANEYYLIAVAGTHGKTTTTAMLIDIFEEAGLDPSGIVGSLRTKTKSNYRRGKSRYFIVEACEYRRDFLSLTPDALVITNIEHEHVDYYKSLEEVQSAFKELIGQVREEGMVIANMGDKNVAPCLEGADLKVIDYREFFNPLRKLKVPGVHNQMNAAAAIATAHNVGVQPLHSERAVEEFAGTWRRFEYKGELNGAKVYDDYGHHPTAIQATINGAKEMFPDKKLFLIYQPHLDSRTEGLFDQFACAFAGVDNLILYPAYVARTDVTPHDTTLKLTEAISAGGAEAMYMDDFDAIVKEVTERVTDEYIILVMGAGDITNVATQLVS